MLIIMPLQVSAHKLAKENKPTHKQCSNTNLSEHHRVLVDNNFSDILLIILISSIFYLVASFQKQEAYIV